jgi:hypothetical protein
MSLNKGGDDPVRKPLALPKEEIKSKKPQVQPIESDYQKDEKDPFVKAYYDKKSEEFKQSYEKGLAQREISELRKREAAMGGSKNVTKKIQRRAKFKKALDNTIMFLGSK